MPSHLLFSSCAFFVYKIHKPITWLIVPTNYWIYEQHQPILSIQTHCSLFDSNILFSLPLTAVVVQIYSAFKKNKYSFFLRWSVWERINSLCVCFFFDYFSFRCSIRCCGVHGSYRTGSHYWNYSGEGQHSICYQVRRSGRRKTRTDRNWTNRHTHTQTLTNPFVFCLLFHFIIWWLPSFFSFSL